MLKNSLKLGDIGQLPLISSDLFVALKAKHPNTCTECWFEAFPYNCYCSIIACKSQDREDNNDVIYKQIIV